MGAVKEMMIEIREYIEEGDLSLNQIADKFGVPLDMVMDIYEELFAENVIDDMMDGDHASALASAGWGTDEDYCVGDML